MQAFDLAKEQVWNPKHHVEKILGKVDDGDFTVACWEPGQTSPNHCHPNATEIYFCYSGGGKMNMPDGSVVDIIRIMILAAANVQAAPMATKAMGSIWPPGRTMTTTPMKPAIVAVQRLRFTISRSTMTATTVVNRIRENARAVASASGR